MNAEFLDKAMGLDFEKYVYRTFRGNPLMNLLQDKEGEYYGTNVYNIIALDKFLKINGMRVATGKDLEQIIAERTLDLKGSSYDTYVKIDFPNCHFNQEYDKLFRELKDILRERKLDPRGNPIIIPINELKITRDNTEKYSITIGKESQLYVVPQYGIGYYGRKFDECDQEGFPIIKEDGKRKIEITQRFCLSKVYIDGELGIKNSGGLSSRNKDSRVVVVKN